MKKTANTAKNRKSKRLPLITLAVVAVAAVGFLVWNGAKAQTVSAQNTVQTVSLAKADLTKTLSASGVVKSENSQNVYSMLNYPVQEIYVKVGDRVKTGDVLARLDMSKLENDISQAELNLKSAENSAAEETRTNRNGVVNAQTSLETSRVSLERQQLTTANAEKDLAKAEEDAAEPFDSYTYDKNIDDARISLERKTTDLADAEKDLETARKAFDGYSYQNAVNEAKITLDRKKADLADAESDLKKEKAKSGDAFDEYTYQNAIDTAERNYYRKLNDYYSADAAQLETAYRAMEDAQAAWDKAIADKEKAEDDHAAKNKEKKDDKVTAAEKVVTTAQKAVDDAQRAYDKAKTDLTRAQDDAAEKGDDAYKAAETARNKAQNALIDAQRAYEKALSDKERAITDYIDANATKLENAQKTAADSARQLESAETSLKSAQNALNQAAAKPANSGVSVELQKLGLEKLNSQLAEGLIIATADGVITELNAKVGAVPSGILFVIEDVDDLYISANVKEYSLSQLSIGQTALVTTDATGDSVYNARLSYMSPKAVSAAGSTSVEFEIRADLNDSPADVKIGMNAFLNIVTDTRAEAYAVPLSAVVTNERGSFVYTIDGDAQKEIAVTLGLKTATQVEIAADGLYDGLEILTDPEGKLSDGSSSTSFPFGGR